MSNPESTLDRIQREIRENLQREDELRNGYHKYYNGNSENGSVSSETEEHEEKSRTNGIIEKVNGSIEKSSENTVEENKQNNFIRKFTPNTTTRGVMQKFFKSRGKIAMSSVKTNDTRNGWQDIPFEPPKLNLENGKPIRNGYVPTEEKIVKELYDFQQREAELRNLRRQSQPDLMALLELEKDLEPSEWENSLKESKNLKHTKSVANLYQPDEEKVTQINSAPCSLKPARSLAALCDLSDDELDMPGTHSLIMQFENMKV